MVISIVLSGAYEAKLIKTSKEGAYIELDKSSELLLNSESVLSYEVIESVEDKKFSSTLKRGVAGGVLAGGVGALAGISTTKGEMTYKIKLVFADGKTSLIQADKYVYDKIVFHCISSGLSQSPALQSSNRFCSNCGASLTGAGRFCSSCGYSNEQNSVTNSVHHQQHTQSVYSSAFFDDNAQNVIIYKGIKFDLDSIYVDCKGKPIKFSMRMMKEAKNLKMSKEESKRFNEAVDLFLKPKVSGQTPNIGVVTIS